ncbi:alpha-glucosidase [Cellulomonas hominis]|uniref:Glucohydrolase n=1 Tax=Cellulomonas hominis TaxID=156981 RepID=A0A511FGV0_9CELL|nr:alpha-glucosidase [Cellulomonas hominis]MBB5471676.1 oligo-1,6-glucosidase [Cellulomonas hominis]MBU5423586.1 alpha-glucosidase [Cellulomonas hominis]NKY07505.1 alpha-glucosidase [Cellulomonas hominis]GEL47804.1 glucohydrolase [Cellulomonas hominis]
MAWTVEDAPWWTRAVVYQIYPRSFQDSDGDGVGDLRGVLSRLDHLEALGVDVVWLSPIYRSPQDDNGYDISDYQDVDPAFGTLADLDELIAALHARGMKLVMDLVVNHTSDEHPWFVESRSSVTSPKRDWYWWRGPRDGMAAGQPGAEPTNWHSFFSGSTWELDEASGEYYLHLFSRKQPDLNWENPEVRAAVHAMMRWWLDRGVDGFRMDVINVISKDTALPDGPVVAGVWGDGSPHYTDGPRVHEFLHEMHREVFEGRAHALLTVGETPGVTLEEALRYTDPARREVDMVFQFEHVGLDHGPGGKFDPKPLRLTDLKATFGRWQAGLADVGWNSLYWDNHDQPRVVSRFGDDGRYRTESAKALATLLHLHRGTPYVYQGEELGMTNAHFTRFDQYQDIESIRHVAQARTLASATDEQLLAGLAAMSRDNARTPVQWDDTPNAGFTTGRPWLAVNPNHVEVNAAAERADPQSVFHHYRRLIALRHEDPVVALGDFTMLLPDDEQVYAFTRSLDGDALLVVVNVSGQERAVDLAGAWPVAADGGWGDLVLGTHADPGEPAVLRPWEARVVRRPA